MAGKKKSIDISHLIRPRMSKNEYSIWYDADSGRITGIAPHMPEDQGSFVIGSGDICESLATGEKSFKECIVAFDPEQGVNRVMHTHEWLLLLSSKQDIQPIDFVHEEDHKKQFSIVFYKEEKKCALMVNQDAFVTMLRMGNEAQVEAAQKQNIDFYVRDRDTGYLITKHSFQFDLSNDEVMEDDAVWIDQYQLDDVDVLSHKNFCTYAWTWKEKKIERLIKVNRTRVIAALRDAGSAHISLEEGPNNIRCYSNIVNPSNYNIHEDIKIWITRRDHPDALIGCMTIPMDMIAEKKVFDIDSRYLRGLSFSQVDFLTNNQYIRLSSKGRYDHSNQ